MTVWRLTILVLGGMRVLTGVPIAGSLLVDRRLALAEALRASLEFPRTGTEQCA